MSPYGPGLLADIAGVQWKMTDQDKAEVYLDEGSPLSPACQRDAIMLVAAKIALYNNFTHFDFSDNASVPKIKLDRLKKFSGETISVFLCRGNCSTMYSADSVAHILANKFRGSYYTSSDSSDKQCL